MSLITARPVLAGLPVVASSVGVASTVAASVGAASSFVASVVGSAVGVVASPLVSLDLPHPVANTTTRTKLSNKADNFLNHCFSVCPTEETH